MRLIYQFKKNWEFISTDSCLKIDSYNFATRPWFHKFRQAPKKFIILKIK